MIPVGEDKILPALEVGQTLDVKDIVGNEHQTKPPARFTEASLVKMLEEKGIGRPSTYASIIQTIQDRGYVWKKGHCSFANRDGFCGHPAP